MFFTEGGAIRKDVILKLLLGVKLLAVAYPASVVGFPFKSANCVVILYARLFHAVEPSPTFTLSVSVSTPGSPSANTGLAEAQSAAESRLNCI